MSEGQSSASGFFVYVINIFQFDDFAKYINWGCKILVVIYFAFFN